MEEVKIESSPLTVYVAMEQEMTLILVGMALVFIFLFLLSLQGSRSLDNLKKSSNFNVTGFSGNGNEYIAVDAPGRKLALVNISAGQYEPGRDYVQRQNITVIFHYDDLVSTRVSTNKDELTCVTFSFNKQIPEWNRSKQLTFLTGPAVRKFFEKYAQGLDVDYL